MTSAILPEPPNELKEISLRLQQLLIDEIRRDGPVSFARFMEAALYEPGLGYYSAGLHKLGASGDFTTSPELGSLFGQCIARQVSEVGELLNTFDVLEVGAGTGALACSVLGKLEDDQLPERYLILERSADLRAVQQKNLARQLPRLLDRVEWLEEPPAGPWRGVILANEVIDALAVERFMVNKDGLQQLCVTEQDGNLQYGERPAPAGLKQAVDQLGLNLAAGYSSEIQCQLNPWLRSLSENLEQGLALFIDYGYPRAEYYRPERYMGTLMCHYRHRAHDDALFWPGLQDITAWVDFTALAEAADDCGLEVTGYCNQAMFLLGCGLDQIVERTLLETPEDQAESIRNEARHLTLPGMMGERFQVMALSRGMVPDWEPMGFSFQDLRYRL